MSQRIYQIVRGYEDADDSDALRYDPILKIACGRVPVSEGELLASQPTMSRLENHVSRQEVAAIRRYFLDQFIDSYSQPPVEIVLDIDGWDDPTPLMKSKN